MGSHRGIYYCVGGVPYRVRTGVAAVKGRCPRPLDEGDIITVTGDLLLVISERATRLHNILLLPITSNYS